jgi:3-oxoacyl-[acyl-carrier protein] reductase
MMHSGPGMSIDSPRAARHAPGLQRFANMTAVVTGGERGSGLEIARAFAAEGARVAVVSRCAAGGGQAAEGINATYPGSATAYAVDLADHAAVQDLAKRIGGQLGTVNILVNHAGDPRDEQPIRMTGKAWDSQLETHLKAAFNTVQAFMRVLMKADNPRIINIAAAISFIDKASQTNNSAGRAGLIGFTKAVARELAGRAVTCNAVLPGVIATALTAELPQALRQAVMQKIPLGHIGDTADLAAMVTFLASPAARYITGQVIAVDGGLSL